MAALRGNSFVLWLGDTATHQAGPDPAATVYTQVAGLRGTSFTYTKGTVDATTKDDSTGWANVVEDGGLRQVTITADGLWNGYANASHAAMIDWVEGTTFRVCRITDGGTGTNGRLRLQGPFHVESYTRTGELNGNDTFAITLTSAGAIDITHVTPT